MSQFAKIFESIKESPEKEKNTKPAKTSKVVRDSSLKIKEKPVGTTKKQPSSKKDARIIVLTEEKKTVGNAAQVLAQTPAISNEHISKETRKTGKSSNSEYTQVLTYIRRDTHKEIKKALIDDAANRDLSDLVEELLADWLRK